MKFLVLSGEDKKGKFPEWNESNKCEENYIAKHGLKADFKHWAKRSSWTFVEAAILFAGIDPRPVFIDFDLTAKSTTTRNGHLYTGIKNSWPRFKKMIDDFHILQRGTVDNSIEKLASPAYWMAKAIQLEIPIPFVLYAHISQYIERTEKHEKLVEAKAKEIEQQSQAFGKPPQSDWQAWLDDLAAEDADITTGAMLDIIDENPPDCVTSLEKNGSKKYKDWQLTYRTRNGEYKTVGYDIIAAALGRAKTKIKEQT